jgi:hypothetical protein
VRIFPPFKLFLKSRLVIRSFHVGYRWIAPMVLPFPSVPHAPHCSLCYRPKAE